MLYALAEFDDADLMRRTCELAFSGEVKTQNAPFLLNRCIANRFHGELAWSFVQQHWKEANEKFPVNTIVRMVDSTKMLNSDVAEASVQSFDAAIRPPAGVWPEGRLFWNMLGRRGLYDPTAVRRQIAESSAAFAALSGDVPATGIDLRVRQLA